MKRHGNLWHRITDWENLLLAARRAQKSKRFRDNVLEFNYNLEKELFQLQTELRQQTYQPGAYKTFRIYDPKPRLISAAPYRDRVVHHALCNILIPLIEPSFIKDTYANRVGYGSHPPFHPPLQGGTEGGLQNLLALVATFYNVIFVNIFLVLTMKF